MSQLKGKKVGLLATDGFEQSELVSPRAAIAAAGATVHVIAPDPGAIRGWSEGNWAEEVQVDAVLAETKPEDYDALVLPGGVINPDKLRTNSEAIEFVRHFVAAGKPVAAICHAPWTLIDAEAVEGRRMTSWPSLRRDLENAGAQWVDEPVVVDQGIITSRNPGDLDAFNDKTIEEIREGRHVRAA